MVILLMFISLVGWASDIVVVDGVSYDVIPQDKVAKVVASKDGNEYSGDVVIRRSLVVGDKEYAVTSIGEGAFSGCQKLSSVSILVSVTSIGTEAFYDCPSLGTVILPDSLKTIADWAFWGCESMTSLTIPDAVVSIGGYAFDGCVGLTSLNIGRSVADIADFAFGGCKNLEAVYCHAEQVPDMKSEAFKAAQAEYSLLYVPQVALDAYKGAPTWSTFGQIEAIPDPSEEASEEAE